jgi:RND family efflux transporter MFP subunit
MTQQETPVVSPQAPVAHQKKPNRRGGKKKLVKRLVAIAVTAAVLAGIAFGIWFLVFRQSDEAGEIYFEYAGIGSIQSTVQGSGNANAKDSATVTVSAGGTVQELLVSAGDTVSAGQPLFTIFSPAAQEAVTHAQETVTAQQEAVARLQGELAKLNDSLGDLTVTAPFAGKLIEISPFSVDDQVGAGTAVATLVDDSRFKLSLYFSYAYDGMIQPGQQARISLPTAVAANLTGQVEQINRVSFISPEGGDYFEVVLSFPNPGTLTAGQTATAVLYAADGSPIYPYDSAQSEYYQTKTITTKASGAVVTNHLLRYAKVGQGAELLVLSPEELNRQQEEKRQEIEAANTQLSDAQAALEEARRDLEQLNAVAPIDGTVLACTLTQGGEVKAGDAVLTISDTTTMVVSITVDDRNIGFVRLGDEIQLTDYNGNAYLGTVTNINSQGEVGQGMSTFPVTIEVDNWDGALYAGAWLDYSFVTSQSEDCVLVPTTAVKSVIDENGDKQTVVFVYREDRPDNVVALDPSITNVPTEADGYYPVPVETGISDARNVEIKRGVDDGDQVFINYTVTDGSSSWGY